MASKLEPSWDDHVVPCSVTLDVTFGSLLSEEAKLILAAENPHKNSQEPSAAADRIPNLVLALAQCAQKTKYHPSN